MASLNEIKQSRLEKIENLKKTGMNPYSFDVKRDHTLEEVVENFEKTKDIKK